MEKMANFAPPCDVRRRAGGTRLRVTLSLMLVLALVFGCVGMFAGEAMALGASGDGGTGGYVYIRNVKTGMYLTFPDTTVNTTSFLQVRTYYGTPANSARQQWRVHHGQ
ncbi:MAG: RICIN domain-containing protein, partial [Oscillospiraceae bacterium]|nr:RICIN domain-containing protein [Oscillospiraceae bacterium]